MTGSLDKNVKIFDVRNIRYKSAIVNIGHKTGIRALEWSTTHRHTILTGGGETDRTLRMFKIN